MSRKITAAMMALIISLAACTDEPSPSASAPEPPHPAVAASDPVRPEIASAAVRSDTSPSKPKLSPEEIDQKAHDIAAQAKDTYLQALEKKFGPAK